MQRLQATGNGFMQDLNPASDFGKVVRLLVFVQTALAHDVRKSLHVLPKKDWIVQHDLMAVVAKDVVLLFLTPRARVENRRAHGAFTVARAPKEALSHVMMAAGMAAPFDALTGIFAATP